MIHYRRMLLLLLHLIPISIVTSLATTTSKNPQQQMHLFNSLTNQKELFEPIAENHVRMYTCGPTVYDYAHVGNFRAFLTYDVLKRALMYFGYEVDHICNLTDVDDKIIKRCNEQNVSLKDLTNKYANLFMKDLKALNVVPAREYPRATDHIDEMVQMIQDLEANGLAYKAESGEDSWYFRVDQKEGYGQQLVKLDVESMRKTGMAGAQRGEVSDADEYDADKVGVRDFALWKAFKPDFDRDDAIWDTAIGRGRPGWHLECSAMAKKYLGDSIDIHCGGIDLKFPHHENEIAQSEGANQKKFCNCWLHNGFVNIGDEKMSKSKGNFLTLRGACPKADDVRAYRYLVVSSQYRNPLSFTDAAMKASKSAIKRMDKVYDSLTEALGSNHGDAAISKDTSDLTIEAEKQMNNFKMALADDLSMPRAAASLFGVIKAAEKHFKQGESYDIAGLTAIKNTIDEMDKVFGIFYEVPMTEDEITEEAAGNEVPDDVMELVNARIEAKTNKDWELADELRGKITQLGFQVKDVKDGAPEVTPIET